MSIALTGRLSRIPLATGSVQGSTTRSRQSMAVIRIEGRAWRTHAPRSGLTLLKEPCAAGPGKCLFVDYPCSFVLGAESPGFESPALLCLQIRTRLRPRV
jgi:hypothetical protein